MAKDKIILLPYRIKVASQEGIIYSFAAHITPKELKTLTVTAVPSSTEYETNER